MKKISFFTAIGLITAVWFSACTQDETMDDNTLPEGKYPLEIASVTMSVESSERPWNANAPQTRVAENTTDGNSSTWEWNGSEKIGVQLYADGETATYTLNNDNTLTPDKTLYWKNTQQTTVNAWYPTDATVNLADQSKKLVYVLTGSGTGSYNSPVTLNFSHALAKVRVTLQGDQADKVKDVKIKSHTTCTHTNGTNIQGSNESWITMMPCTRSAKTVWEANVVPGKAIEQFQVNGVEGTLNNDGIIPVKATVNTITLTVGKNIVEDGTSITEAGEYTMSGEYTQGVTLNGDGITLTLDGASINTHGTAINIVSGIPTVKIQGTENHAKSTTSTAIHVGSGCTLTIEGLNGAADKLKAEGGKNEGTMFGPGNAGVGIGSSNGGNIIIKNVTIEATGETFSHWTSGLYGGGAAIGSSGPGYCGDITITDATIFATGGYLAAAIGMGYSIEGSEDSNLKMGTIRISNSIITAKGGESASAIGFPYLSYQQKPTAGEIYIETKESSSTFLNRLTITSGKFKIGKGSFNDYNSFYGTDGGTWPGVTLKASDGTQTSPDGIGQ